MVLALLLVSVLIFTTFFREGEGGFLHQLKGTVGAVVTPVQEAAVGLSKWDDQLGRVTVSDVVYYPADCVNPPDGVTGIDWIKGGFSGAKCP